MSNIYHIIKSSEPYVKTRAKTTHEFVATITDFGEAARQKSFLRIHLCLGLDVEPESQMTSFSVNPKKIPEDKDKKRARWQQHEVIPPSWHSSSVNTTSG